MTHPALIERITRSLAYMLRHQPEKFDLELDRHGFARLDEVVRALQERLGEPVDAADVHAAVDAGDRPRYEITGDLVRALYGHSIDVEPGEPARPPEFLYVGIEARDLSRAQQFGLRGGRRRFLHLALSLDDAREAGRRAAREYSVLRIYALDAWEEGVNFFDRKALFLAEHVPTEYIEVLEQGTDGYDERGEDSGPRRSGGARGGAPRNDGRREHGGGHAPAHGGADRERRPDRGERSGERREHVVRDEPRREDARRPDAGREHAGGDEPRRDEPRRDEGRRDEPRRDEAARHDGRRGRGRRNDERHELPVRDDERREPAPRDERGPRDDQRRPEPRRDEPRRDDRARDDRPREDRPRDDFRRGEGRPAAERPVAASRGRDERPRDEWRSSEPERDWGGRERGDRGERGERSDRGDRGERRDRGPRPDGGGRFERRDEAPRERAPQPQPVERSAPRAAPAPAAQGGDFGLGIFDEPAASKPAASAPPKRERPAAPPPPPPAADFASDFGAGL